MADTRCSKRLKTSSSNDDDNSSDDQTAPAAAAAPRSPASFYSLPEELRSRVLDLAFHRPLPLHSMAGAGSREVDAATTLRLARTSRWLYQRVVFFIYRDIKITRPSALALLQRTLSAHPQLGRVIKSLHVGPEDEATEGETSPITVQARKRDAQGNWRPASYRISSSLRSPRDVGLLPQWCTPGKEWSFNYEGEDAKALAISQALLAINESLGLDLDRLHSWQPPTATTQIYEAQAGLDLYLMALRRFDDSTSGSGASDSPCNDEAEYPPLILVGTAAQPTLTSAMVQDKPYVITRQQVLQHLARPGCVFDTFDHPLLFARSGLETGNVNATLRRAEPDSYHRWSAEDPADIFTSNGIQDADEPSTKWENSLDFLDPALTSIPTTGSLLGLLRSLLALTPGLETLSLTGFLERAVCGSRPIGAVLKKLRGLSVGPPPLLSTWHAPLEFEGINRVRQLRICGVMLRGDEVGKLGCRYSNLQWTMPNDMSGKALLRLGVIIDQLVQRTGVAADAALRQLGFEELDKLKLPFTYSALQEDPLESENDKGKYPGYLVEIRLPPKVRQAMLDRASCPEERADWIVGLTRHNQRRRLLLVELPEVAVGSPAVMRQAMYDECREWWEEQRKSLGPRHYAMGWEGRLNEDVNGKKRA